MRTQPLVPSRIARSPGSAGLVQISIAHARRLRHPHGIRKTPYFLRFRNYFFSEFFRQRHWSQYIHFHAKQITQFPLDSSRIK